MDFRGFGKIGRRKANAGSQIDAGKKGKSHGFAVREVLEKI
jgi:hypothetical protein